MVSVDRRAAISRSRPHFAARRIALTHTMPAKVTLADNAPRRASSVRGYGARRRGDRTRAPPLL